MAEVRGRQGGEGKALMHMPPIILPSPAPDRVFFSIVVTLDELPQSSPFGLQLLFFQKRLLFLL